MQPIRSLNLPVEFYSATGSGGVCVWKDQFCIHEAYPQVQNEIITILAGVFQGNTVIVGGRWALYLSPEGINPRNVCKSENQENTIS